MTLYFVQFRQIMFNFVLRLQCNAVETSLAVEQDTVAGSCSCLPSRLTVNMMHCHHRHHNQQHQQDLFAEKLNKKMPESRPEDALGTLVKLVQTVCTKYLTLLHCEISD